MTARKRKPGEKPTISDEARQRLTAFVGELEALQARMGVQIWVEDDTLAFLDTQRKDNWDGEGTWDAKIYGAGSYRQGSKPGRRPILRVKNLEFENFDWWEK